MRFRRFQARATVGSRARKDSAVSRETINANPAGWYMGGIFAFDMTFKATRYNLGAAASIVMLLLVAMVIVPYLWRNLRRN